MNNAADRTAVVYAFDAAHIHGQMRFNSRPLLVAQPKQLPAHRPSPIRINIVLENLKD
jgi:hypothetical protein